MWLTPSTDISASLAVSVGNSGHESSRASTGASVDVPLAGRPDTTTNTGCGALGASVPTERLPSGDPGR